MDMHQEKIEDMIDEVTKTTSDERYFHKIKIWFPISALIGLIVGIVMALYFLFIYLIAQTFDFISPLLLLFLGGFVVLVMIKTKFIDGRESGITAMIKAKHKGGDVPFSKLKSFLSTGIAYGAGLPIGREGPSLIMGSSIAIRIAKFFKIDDAKYPHVLTIGSAAATGALFQAPFGSAVFAAEVPYKEDSDEPVLMAAFLSSVIATVTMATIINFLDRNHFAIELHIFRVGEASLETTFSTVFEAMLLGLTIGLVSIGFIRLYYFYKNEILSKFTQFRRVSIGFTIMMLILIIVYLIDPEIYLVNHNAHIIENNYLLTNSAKTVIPILILAIFAQFFATSALVASGFPGGVFGPSLAIGAMFGMIFSIIFGISDPSQITAFIVIGMSASHAAFTKTPIASVLLILEVTGLPHLIMPMVIANLVAHMTSGHRSLYEGQIDSRDTMMARHITHHNQLTEFHIKDLMTPRKDLIYATPDENILELKQKIMQSSKRTFPVMKFIEEIFDYRLVGIITLEDINNAMDNRPHPSELMVKEIMTKEVITLHPDMSAEEALRLVIDSKVERAPVVEDGLVVGIATIKDILRGHKRHRDHSKEKVEDKFREYRLDED